MRQMEQDKNDGQPELTQEDVEQLLANSYIPELAEVDRAKLTEFANLVADHVMQDYVSIPTYDLNDPRLHERLSE